MKQQFLLLVTLLASVALSGPCETDDDCGGEYFCNCNFKCDKCDENGLNCAAEAVSGRPSGCTDNPGMDQGSDTHAPSPSPTGMFDGSDPDTPRDPGCCMALDWSDKDADKCINAYKAFYCDNEPGWENCYWIEDEDHQLQEDCAQPDDSGHDTVCNKMCMSGFECVFNDDGSMACQPEGSDDGDCGCTKELMPYCCDGQRYDNECLGYCAGAQECLGMKHPDNSCTDDSSEDGGDDDEGCCLGETERQMSKCARSPSESNCDGMNGCMWSPTCTVPTPAPGCCYATDANNRKASDCYGIDYDKCAAGARMSCAWKEGDENDCALPTAEPGCCYGSDNACDTDDEVMCLKGKRKGCEWRAGKDADCTPVPGCCSGPDDSCFGLAEAQCAQMSRRKGCEWITGTTECVPPTPEPGCCYASDPGNRMADRCYDIDAAACAKGARMSCAWKSGHDADCSVPTPEPGCCAAETERKVNSCSKSPSATNCDNMNGCFWVSGADADCTFDDGSDDVCSKKCMDGFECVFVDDHGNMECQKADDGSGGAMCCGDDASKMNMCSNSMSMNNCNNMNGCHWVMEAADCDTETERFLFAGEAVREAMNSQVSLSTLLLAVVCLAALWKLYGWWSNASDNKLQQQSTRAHAGYQSV